MSVRRAFSRLQSGMQTTRSAPVRLLTLAAGESGSTVITLTPRIARGLQRNGKPQLR